MGRTPQQIFLDEILQCRFQASSKQILLLDELLPVVLHADCKEEHVVLHEIPIPRTDVRSLFGNEPERTFPVCDASETIVEEDFQECCYGEGENIYEEFFECYSGAELNSCSKQCVEGASSSKFGGGFLYNGYWVHGNHTSPGNSLGRKGKPEFSVGLDKKKGASDANSFDSCYFCMHGACSTKYGRGILYNGCRVHGYPPSPGNSLGCMHALWNKMSRMKLILGIASAMFELGVFTFELPTHVIYAMSKLGVLTYGFLTHAICQLSFRLEPFAPLLHRARLNFSEFVFPNIDDHGSNEADNIGYSQASGESRDRLSSLSRNAILFSQYNWVCHNQNMRNEHGLHEFVKSYKDYDVEIDKTESEGVGRSLSSSVGPSGSFEAPLSLSVV